MKYLYIFLNNQWWSGLERSVQLTMAADSISNSNKIIILDIVVIFGTDIVLMDWHSVLWNNAQALSSFHELLKRKY